MLCTNYLLLSSLYLNINMSGTLYGIELSQPARSCLLLIKEANLDIPLKRVNILVGEQKSEEFRAINPSGQIPAFKDGDFTLAEGAAILTYLADAHHLEDWYPTDHKARARVNQWLHWHHGGSRLSTKAIMVPTLFGGEVNTDGFESNLTLLNNALADSKYIASENHPTLADLLILPELDQLEEGLLGCFDYSPYSNIVRYLVDLKAALPSYAQNLADAASILETLKSKSDSK